VLLDRSDPKSEQWRRVVRTQPQTPHTIHCADQGAILYAHVIDRHTRSRHRRKHLQAESNRRRRAQIGRAHALTPVTDQFPSPAAREPSTLSLHNALPILSYWIDLIRNPSSGGASCERSRRRRIRFIVPIRARFFTRM